MSLSLLLRLQIHAIFHSGIGFIIRQCLLSQPRLPSSAYLTGQTALVTGSNTGLGLTAARQLLSLNLSRLIVAVRSESKGEVAARSLAAEFPNAAIEVWRLDMEDYDSITTFVNNCKADAAGIDIAILNAGVQNKDKRVSVKTGHEQTFQVNYLSTVLLAVLLLPVLQKKGRSSGRPARLSIVTSTTAYFGNDFQLKESSLLQQFDEQKYNVTKWYAREKLLQMVFFKHLAELVSPDDIVLNLVCPGLVGETEIWRDLNKSPTLKYVFRTYCALFGRTVSAGASTYVHATVVRGKESHGGFLSDWRLCP